MPRKQLSITAVSEYLVEQTKNLTRTKSPIHHLPNGVDIDKFQQKGRESTRVISLIIPHPRITFVGALNNMD